MFGTQYTTAVLKYSKTILASSFFESKSTVRPCVSRLFCQPFHKPLRAPFGYFEGDVIRCPNTPKA
jgi:hypothetical protein